MKALAVWIYVMIGLGVAIGSANYVEDKTDRGGVAFVGIISFLIWPTFIGVLLVDLGTPDESPVPRVAS